MKTWLVEAMEEDNEPSISFCPLNSVVAVIRSISNLSISVENLSAAESQIRDADIAEEVALLTRNQILVQASTAMVGQANLIPQSVLQLLG